MGKPFEILNNCKKLASACVITGCDEKQEWLLKWWWKNYSRSNSAPVIFMDFGMTNSAKNWCKKNGQVVDVKLSSNFIKKKENITKDRAKLWEEMYVGDVWESRETWFKKPFCLLMTNYNKNLWIDLDCEIKETITPIINTCENPLGISIVREPKRVEIRSKKTGFLKKDESLYNSGVIAFKKTSPIIKLWAIESILNNDKFMGDQDVLSKIIYKNNLNVCELPAIYNWRPTDGENDKAKIIHHTGSYWKTKILMKL